MSICSHIGLILWYTTLEPSDTINRPITKNPFPLWGKGSDVGHGVCLSLSNSSRIFTISARSSQMYLNISSLSSMRAIMSSSLSGSVRTSSVSSVVSSSSVSSVVSLVMVSFYSIWYSRSRTFRHLRLEKQLNINLLRFPISSHNRLNLWYTATTGYYQLFM